MLGLQGWFGRRSHDRILHIERDVIHRHFRRFIKADAAFPQCIRQFQLRVDDLLKVVLADAGAGQLSAKKHLPHRVKFADFVVDDSIEQRQGLPRIGE